MRKEIIVFSCPRLRSWEFPVRLSYYLPTEQIRTCFRIASASLRRGQARPPAIDVSFIAIVVSPLHHSLKDKH